MTGTLKQKMKVEFEGYYNALASTTTEEIADIFSLRVGDIVYNESLDMENDPVINIDRVDTSSVYIEGAVEISQTGSCKYERATMWEPDDYDETFHHSENDIKKLFSFADLKEGMVFVDTKPAEMVG